MQKEDKFEDSMAFVVSHYDDDAFSTRKAWIKLFAPYYKMRRKRFAAAAATVCVVMAASAFIYQLTRQAAPGLHEKDKTEMPAAQPQPKGRDYSVRLEFTDAPLKEVVAEIEKVYGVRIKNVPDYSERLTISYEGTAEDLIESINEITGASMTVER